MSYVDKINVEGQDYDLGKPLYWHGILIQKYVEGQAVLELTLVVINNTNTPINTWAKLKAIFEAWGNNALINTNGFYANDVGYEMPNVNYMYLFEDNNVLKLQIGGNSSNATPVYVSKELDSFDDIFTNVEDRVNKIN